MTDDSAIEALYELTPTQRGMLFHTLYAELPGIYVDQVVCRLEGRLRPDVLYLAWQRTIERHPVLRSAFLWEEVDEPLQVASRSVQIPWQQLDWRSVPPAEKQEHLYDWLAQDRASRFDLAVPPLLRLVLAQVSDDNYLLIWTFHHLLLDGWSMGLVLQEVLTIYEAHCAGRPPQLEQRRPYWDYLQWLREQDIAKAEAFWTLRLQDIVAPTPIFTERLEHWADTGARGHMQMDLLDQGQPSPSAVAAQQFWQHSGQGVRLQGLRLARKLTENLRAFGRRHQLTLNTLIQGAWALLLSHYSTSSDVLFGATVAGRPTSLYGAESMIGLFINTLPVRVKVPPHMKLLDWLELIQTQEAEARQYEYTPLVQVHGWSKVPRNRPLFESIIVFENYPVDQMLTSGNTGNGSITFRWEYVLEQTNYPLVVVVAPWHELEILFGYEAARFAPETISRMQLHLQTLLESFLAYPDALLSAIPMLTPNERYQLLVEWNQPQKRVDESSVPELLRLRAAHTPDLVALVYGDEQITYEALLQRANECATYLRRQGIGPETRVGVCLERGPNLAIALLGTLIAGGVYVPVAPSYPEARRRALLADAAISVVLTHHKWRNTFAILQAPVICLDTDWPIIVRETSSPRSGELISAPFHLDQAAYLLYTSGSTGQPKGVIVSHRALAHHNAAVIEHYKLQPQDRVLQFASISFDVSLEEILPSWCSGATVVLCTQSVAPSLEELTQMVAELGLTVLNLPSSYWHEWVVELARTRRSLSKELRLLIAGSEPVLPRTLELWRSIGGDQVAWCNAYGLTETTITALCTQPEEVQRRAYTLSVPIGRPLSGVQAYVLDAQLQPVPIGIPGELYIGGSGLARGYLGQPDLTAERFVPDPFAEVQIASTPDSPSPLVQGGGRLYRTGDRVRYLPDGSLEYLGRVDTQVKLRGFRIEPGEIETLIRKYPGVRDAFVIAQHEQTQTLPYTTGNTGQVAISLIAYVLTTRRTTSLQERLQRYLEAHLPAYMVPTRLVVLDALPRMPGGKIDLNALAALDRPQATQITIFEAPKTPVEEILANIWSVVLRLQSVGRQDHFFRLGGHSLQATQIIARIREAFHLDLPVRALYDAPTIVALGEYIQQLRHGPHKIQRLLDSVTTVARDKPLPLSFAQQRLWVLMQMEPHSSFYNMTSAIRLHGSITIFALEKSINTLVKRHEPLRTTFALIDDLPMQIIAPELHLAIPLIDLTGLEDPTERATIAKQLLLEEEQRVFDLAHGPLLSCHLLQLAATEHMLLLSIHHIVADGWSIGILVQELSTLYSAYIQDQAPALPPLPLQYVDYACWQSQWLEEKLSDTIHRSPQDELLDYWREQLNEAPAFLELPADYPRPPFTTFNGAFQVFQIPVSLCRGLRALSQSESITLFMTLLAAFQVLLMRYTEQEDLVIGTPIAGRTLRETEAVVGLFLNTLVLRTDLSGNPAFRELLARVRDVCLDADEHQGLPFEKLVEELQPVRNPGYTPLIQVIFALQNLPAEERLSLQGLTTNPVTVERRTAKFDLTFLVEERGEELAVIVEYNTDLFKSTTITRLGEHYQQLLSTCVADPECPIWNLQLLTDAERTQILVDWNDTRTLYPRQTCIHEVFSEQADRTPDAIALVYDDQQMTYQELNIRANLLAHYLQGAGVTAEVPVGICLERSLDMIIGLLGILKAGGVYTPLDPQYPENRLAFLARDARIGILLSHERWRERWQLIGKGIPILYLDSEWDTIAQGPATNPITTASSKNLAYIMYTSGSTGEPKGASITHQSVLRLVKETNYAHLTAEEIFLHFAPLAFDASTFEIWGSLLNGARLILFPDELPSLHELGLVLQREHVTTLWLTAGLFHQMVENQLEDLKSVRHLLAGGDALSLPHVQKALQQLDACQLINGYGPTENTTFSTTYPFPRPDIGVVPIGRAIANTTLYVLDRFLQPVPVGVPGELYVGGDGLARGYLERPDITAERFIPHPFTSQPGERLYRTGDRVRYLPDGNLAFLGRIDQQQVKLRGFRIELGEIETVLKIHPTVQNAVVILREDRPGDRQLVAYIIPTQATPSLSSELRDYARQHLPDYMIPSTIIQLEEYPLNPNGKVDRRKLPIPTRGQLPGAENDGISARTEVEHILSNIWSEILGLSQIGIHDNFFELGGDSIQVIQVCARARLSHLQLTPKQIFQHQTIAQLANIVTSAPTDTSPPLRPEAVPGPIPLTPIQHWFFGQDLPEPHHWNQALLFSTPTPLHLFALRQALAHLISHHAAFRLRFSQDAAQGWLQILEPPSRLQAGAELLPLVDLSALPASQQVPIIQKLCTQTQASLDLEQPPLLRGLLLLRGSELPPLLLLVLHHLIVDTFSWSILLQDLATAYQQACDDTPIRLVPATTSFPAFADLSEQAASSSTLLQEAPFWLRQTELAHTLPPLPRDLQESPQENSEVFARAVQIQLTRQETDALLHQVPAAYQTQINEVLLTALALTLRAWTGRQHLFLHLEGHGRQGWEGLAEEADLSRSVGWFTTLYPLLLSLEGRHRLEQCLLTIKEQVRAVPRQGTGYGLLRYLGSDPALRQALAAAPAPQISFNYLGVIGQEGGEQDGFRLAPEESGPPFSLEGNRSHLLDLLGQVRDGQLHLTWIYSQQVHARSTVERLAQRYLETLRAIIEHCLSPEAGGHSPSDFPLAKLDEKTFSKIARLLEKGER